MDLTVLLGQYAFPIVACCAMAWYVKDSQKTNREDIKEMRKEHEAEVDKLSEAVNNNTVILEKLLTLLGRNEK